MVGTGTSPVDVDVGNRPGLGYYESKRNKKPAKSHQERLCTPENALIIAFA